MHVIGIQEQNSRYFYMFRKRARHKDLDRPTDSEEEGSAKIQFFTTRLNAYILLKIGKY